MQSNLISLSVRLSNVWVNMLQFYIPGHVYVFIFTSPTDEPFEQYFTYKTHVNFFLWQSSSPPIN